MNTNHRRPAWTLALAAITLTLATACGTDASDGTTRILDPAEKDGSSDTRPFTPRQDGGGDGPAAHPRDDLPQKGVR
ncbi:MAG: hypothetical protein ACRDOM_09945 [Nocardioides sp.]